MGLARAPDTGNELFNDDGVEYEEFKKMRQWKTWEKKSDGKSFVECTPLGMGVNPSEV